MARCVIRGRLEENTFQAEVTACTKALRPEGA